jgi:hypothetical protein
MNFHLKAKTFFSILILFFLFSLFFSVQALGAEIKLNCPNSSNIGQTFQVDLAFSNFEEIAPNGLGGFGPVKIKYNNMVLELLNINKSNLIPSNFSFDQKIEDGIATISVSKSKVFTDAITLNNATVATFTFKVRANSAEGMTEVSIISDAKGFVSANDSTINYDNKITKALPSKISIGPKLSNEAHLAELSVANAELTPAFSPEISSYNIKSDFNLSNAEVLAVPYDIKAKVKIEFNKRISTTETAISVTVVAQDGSTKTYNIIGNFIATVAMTSDMGLYSSPVHAENAKMKTEITSLKQFIVTVVCLAFAIILILVAKIISEYFRKKRNKLQQRLWEEEA